MAGRDMLHGLGEVLRDRRWRHAGRGAVAGGSSNDGRTTSWKGKRRSIGTATAETDRFHRASILDLTNGADGAIRVGRRAIRPRPRDEALGAAPPARCPKGAAGATAGAGLYSFWRGQEQFAFAARLQKGALKEKTAAAGGMNMEGAVDFGHFIGRRRTQAFGSRWAALLQD